MPTVPTDDPDNPDPMDVLRMSDIAEIEEDFARYSRNEDLSDIIYASSPFDTPFIERQGFSLGSFMVGYGVGAGCALLGAWWVLN